MLGYWLMFVLPAGMVFVSGRISNAVRNLAWTGIGVLFALMIGLRHQVGGDWFSYLDHYESLLNQPFARVFGYSDIGYYMLNWLAGFLAGEVGLYLSNLVCAALVVAGVVVFARRQPLPWLAIVVSVPYLLIVVSMGYTRQSVALGFVLLALVALTDMRYRWFVFWIICAALYHKSALVMLPLAVLANTRRRVWVALWVGVTGVVLYNFVLVEHLDTLWLNYVENQMVSEGGPIRVALNAVPALLLLFFRKRLVVQGAEGRLWCWIAIFSLACIPLVGVASTAVDRVALYFMPIQLYVFSRIHRLFAARLFKTVAVLGVILGYGFVQWMWLNYAAHAPYWLPYQMYPVHVLLD